MDSSDRELKSCSCGFGLGGSLRFTDFSSFSSFASFASFSGHFNNYKSVPF